MGYWVLNGNNYIASIEMKNESVVLSNGLIKREVMLKNSATKSFFSIENDVELISEPLCDTHIFINRKKISLDDGFTFISAEPSKKLKLVEFKETPSMTEKHEYPPKGKSVDLTYKNDDLKLKIIVHFEIYDFIPTIMKTVFVENYSTEEITIDNIVTDAMSIKDNRDLLFVDSNFNAAMEFLGLEFEQYAKLYARYQYDILEVAPLYRMNVKLKKGEVLQSIVAYEMCFSAEYYEQKLIEIKTMYRFIAPWCLDNVLFFHLISNRTKDIEKAVDECCEVGAEMIIQSFGSGVRMESSSERYLSRIKKAYDYGHKKGIKMGAYTLAYVKNYRPVRGDEALNHDASHICRCLADEWSQKYTKSILNFIDKTGADAIEIDGPYGMMLCSGGKTHLHDDFTDSQYRQWKMSVIDWYIELKKRGIYINAPDWHFLNGINRTGIGYEEIAFSEKRSEQLITSRIYYYKGTFTKSPSQGWGFLPLNVYHGGGKDAIFCPTDKNNFEYDWALAQITASGVWPTIRGKRIYDTQEGKETLTKWISIFKKYRNVLNGITVHFMPPQIDKYNPERTTSIDAILNQLPYGENRGFLMFFNQTDKAIKQKVNVPVFYTGLTNLKTPPAPFANTKNSDIEYPLYGDSPFPLMIKGRDGKERNFITDKKVFDKEIPAMPTPQNTDKTITVSQNDQSPKVYNIDTNGNIQMELQIPPMTYQWFIMKE
ncbi:MAG: hypothetical protein RR552_05570 [Oscillospiraceae bacterium]